MDGEFAITRLMKTVDESDSYEEFALKCAADSRVAALLEFMASNPACPKPPREIYMSLKDKDIGERA